MIKYFILLVVLIRINYLNAQLDKQFNETLLKEDVLFLRNCLEKNHPNLYTYTSKQKVDSLFNALYESVRSPMSGQQFYHYLGKIQNYIKDGHNYILPSTADQNYYVTNATYFPLNFVEHEGKLYVTENFSDDTTIQVGDEITSINGLVANQVFTQLVALQVRDGYNLNYPKWITQSYFRSYYGFNYGFPSEYILGVKNPLLKPKTHVVKALALNEISLRRSKTTAKRYDRIIYEKGIFWEIRPIENAAILTLKTWSNDIFKSEYHQSFKSELKRFMDELMESKVSNLIIDLRGNQGGDGLYGIRLMQYLMDKPFYYFSSVKAYNKKHQLVDVAKRLTKLYKPFDNRFAGKVYVLTNGGSFSNSGIFASRLQEEKRAVIIGEETGGNAVLLCGGEGYYVLPNTKINILKATHQMTVSDQLVNTGHGVIPDVMIRPSLDEVIKNKDVVLYMALTLIGNY